MASQTFVRRTDYRGGVGDARPPCGGVVASCSGPRRCRRHLVRVRQGRFVVAGTPADMVAAAARSGRAARLASAFWRSTACSSTTTRDATCSRSPGQPTPPAPRGVAYHWRRTAAPRERSWSMSWKALAQATRCQPPRSAIATLDSAGTSARGRGRHREGLRPRARAFQVLRVLVDPRAEAGTETLVRLLLRHLGCRWKCRYASTASGRVDLLVTAGSSSSATVRSSTAPGTHKNDRRRDMALSSAGTRRPSARRGHLSTAPTASALHSSASWAHGAPGQTPDVRSAAPVTPTRADIRARIQEFRTHGARVPSEADRCSRDPARVSAGSPRR